jgi:hypothetical protein
VSPAVVRLLTAVVVFRRVSSLQAFARAFYEDNKSRGGGDSSGDPRFFNPNSPDVVEVLTFSLIMLHTDAHNPNVKKERKMTLQQFISNNRCGSCRLPPGVLPFVSCRLLGLACSTIVSGWLVVLRVYL